MINEKIIVGIIAGVIAAISVGIVILLDSTIDVTNNSSEEKRIVLGNPEKIRNFSSEKRGNNFLLTVVTYDDIPRDTENLALSELGFGYAWLGQDFVKLLPIL